MREGDRIWMIESHPLMRKGVCLLVFLSCAPALYKESGQLFGRGERTSHAASNGGSEILYDYVEQRWGTGGRGSSPLVFCPYLYIESKGFGFTTHLDNTFHCNSRPSSRPCAKSS